MKSYLSLMYVLVLSLISPSLVMATQESTSFVLQLTRTGDNYGHRRVFLQLDKVLNDLGEKNLNIEVVAYEDGIKSLLANNKETSQLLTKLANRGVTFKACRISMRSWDLTDEDFPLEVEYVPAGAPEVIKLQMKGYKYWRP